MKTDHKTLWIETLHQCENKGNVPKVLDTNGKYSYGYLQFQMGTWLKYSKQFGTTVDNISSTTLQIKVARYMLDHGGRDHWYTCARVTERKMGKY